jgi:hypothetical protein
LDALTLIVSALAVNAVEHTTSALFEVHLS